MVRTWPVLFPCLFFYILLSFYFSFSICLSDLFPNHTFTVLTFTPSPPLFNYFFSVFPSPLLYFTMLLRLSVFPSLFSWFSYLHSTIILYFCPAGNVYLGHICLRFLSNFASREGKCSKWHVSNCKFNLPPHLLHTHLKDREDIQPQNIQIQLIVNSVNIFVKSRIVKTNVIKLAYC